jgi:hypothetical protein
LIDLPMFFASRGNESFGSDLWSCSCIANSVERPMVAVA